MIGIDNRKAMWAVRLSLGFFLLLIILFRVDFNVLIYDLRRSKYEWVFAAAFAFGLSRFCEGCRLSCLAKYDGIGLMMAWRAILVSTYFNNVSTIFVGDGYRVAFLREKIQNWSIPLAIVSVERIVGFCVVGMLGLWFVFFRSGWLIAIRDRTRFNWGCFSYLAAVGVVFAIIALICAVRYLQKERGRRVMQFAYDTAKAMKSFRLWQIFVAFLVTITAQIAIALKIYWLVKSFGGTVSLPQSIFTSLTVFLASWLPFSIGGLGIREGAIVTSLVLFGVSEQVSLTVAIVGRVIMYGYAAVGWVMFSSERKEKV